MEDEDVDGVSCAVDDMRRVEVLTILCSESSRVESSRTRREWRGKGEEGFREI